jgi:hypothetical protein
MTKEDDNARIGEAQNIQQLRAFVEDMARLRVGEDDLADPFFRQMFAQEHDLDSADIAEDDLIDALDDERLHNETATLWEMIRRARILVT